jgi:hypothetical protein
VPRGWAIAIYYTLDVKVEFAASTQVIARKEMEPHRGPMMFVCLSSAPGRDPNWDKWDQELKKAKRLQYIIDPGKLKEEVKNRFKDTVEELSGEAMDALGDVAKERYGG